MRCRFYFHVCIVCMLLSALFGCKVKIPDEIIPEAKFESLLYDYHIAKAMGDELPSHENYKKALYINSVFDKYGITKADFDSSMVWYMRHTEILSEIYTRVTEKFKKEQDLIGDLIAIRDKKPKITKAGDSIDVWPWQRLIRLTRGLNSIYAFNMPTDTNYHERDTIVWEAHFNFLPQYSSDSLHYATMALQILYEKDTVNHLTVQNVSDVTRVCLYADTLGKMKEIKGFIYYPTKSTDVLLIDRISMMRYHCKDSLPFIVRDSLNRAEAMRKDSLMKEAENEHLKDASISNEENTQQRLTPEEMNKRRTGARSAKKPEQLEVERHIQQERKERQMYMRRQQRQQ